MKIIDIPEPIEAVWLEQVTNPVEGIVSRKAALTFIQWLETALDKYAAFSEGHKAAAQAKKIFDILAGVNGSRTVAFEDADYECVKAAPAAVKWNPAINRRAVPFWEALEKAQDVKVPVEPKKG